MRFQLKKGAKKKNPEQPEDKYIGGVDPLIPIISGKGVVKPKIGATGFVRDSGRIGSFKGIRRDVLHAKRSAIATTLIRYAAKITSKGQVTIPADVRKALKLAKGDQIVFEVKGTRANIRKITAIDKLAMEIGPQLGKEFPTPGDFENYLRNRRKELFEKVYGSSNADIITMSVTPTNCGNKLD